MLDLWNTNISTYNVCDTALLVIMLYSVVHWCNLKFFLGNQKASNTTAIMEQLENNEHKNWNVQSEVIKDGESFFK